MRLECVQGTSAAVTPYQVRQIVNLPTFLAAKCQPGKPRHPDPGKSLMISRVPLGRGVALYRDMSNAQQQLQQVQQQLTAAMVAKNATQLRRQLWAQYNALKVQVARENA